MGETTKGTCGASVMVGFTAHLCGKRASVTRTADEMRAAGVHVKPGDYCRTHDPIARNARAEAKSQAWRAESDAQNAYRDAQQRTRDVREACVALVRGAAETAPSTLRERAMDLAGRLAACEDAEDVAEQAYSAARDAAGRRK